MPDIINPLGVHALVWVGGSTPAEVATAIKRTAAAVDDLLELSLHDAVNLDTTSARAELEQAWLAIACSRGLAFDANVSSADPAVVDRGEKLLHDSLQITEELGGTHFTGALYIGADNVIIQLDTYHTNIEEDDLVAPVRLVGDRLGYVHIGENQRGYVGSGHIDFAGFFSALVEIGYTGPITFEWEDGAALATHARELLRTELDRARR